MTGNVRVGLLGVPSLEVAGVPVDLGRSWCLFACLVAARGHVLQRKLREHLWGPGGGSGNDLQKAASLIRTALRRHGLDGTAVLPHGRDGYQLVLPPGTEVDLYRFLEAYNEAQSLVTTAPGRAAGLLEEALRCWRGDPLAGLRCPWAELYQINLEEKRRTARVTLAAVRLEQGHGSDQVPDLSDLYQTYPNDDRIRKLLARALFQAGRPLDARRIDPLLDPERERHVMSRPRADEDPEPGEVVPLPVEVAEPAGPAADEEPAGETPSIRANTIGNVFQGAVSFGGDMNLGWPTAEQ